jgi:hypothetical protein
MTQNEFETKLRELFMPLDGDPEYERKETEATNLVQAAIEDTTKFSGGKWSESAALERWPQWVWFHNQATNGSK